VLDEPTNHLDIEMREALAQALQDFEGTLIVVAHDRHLLEAATDQWWLVADGKVAPFDGDLDDYREWSRQYRVRGTKAEGAGTGADRRAQKRSEAQSRQRLADAKKPFERKIQAIERELAKLQPEKETLDAWLGSTEAYAEAMRGELAERSRRHGELAARIAELEEDWLWNSAAMEAEVNRARE
jgi:ATP-binding cassette subfamily F protein 3